MYIAVADPGFSGGGGAPTPRVRMLTYYLAILLPKLHENETIWTVRGEFLVSPSLDRPMYIQISLILTLRPDTVCCYGIIYLIMFQSV